MRLEFQPGKFFGEISLIQNVPRTANVDALSSTRCLTLDRAAFGRLFGQKVVQDLGGANEMVLPTAIAQTRSRRGSAEEVQAPKFVGATLDDFKLGTHVGFGAFGYVRIAKHKATGVSLGLLTRLLADNYALYAGTIVAIKAMSKGYLVSRNQVRHAIGERDLLKDCHHPGVVQFFGSFQDDSMIYICLEFLNGGELFTLLGLKQVRFSKSHS